jgi:Putative esterase
MSRLQATAFLWVMIAAAAHADCLKGNAGIPSGANTTDPASPFYIDTSGLDFKTLPPTRDPKNPNYPAATELPDGTLPASGAEGNYIIGPTHPSAPEIATRDGVPAGKVYSFMMSSNDSTVFNPGMIRDDPESCLNASVFTAQTAPGDKSNILIQTAHAGIWNRAVDVYVPAEYVAGTEAPFIVLGDGGPKGFFKETQFFTILDNLIHEHRVPPMVAISIGAGGQDAQGSERGLEYDAVSGAYAEFVENEVLPLAETRANVTYQESGRPRDYGHKLERSGGLHDGLVPS